MDKNAAHMEYKKIYTTEELREVIRWFEQRKERLPQTLRLDKGTFIPDFPLTAGYYVAIARKHYANATYGAQIWTLFKMRDRLLEEGME